MLSGHRPEAATEDGPRCFRRLESDRSPFRRFYPLPRGANVDAMRLRLERGVLTITVSPSAAADGKQVMVG